MSFTSKIGSSELAFKLSQGIVSALADKFAFKFEDGWTTVSSRTVENIQKRLKRDKKRANPTSSIKHPRTSFSFFTQRQRPISQLAHPTATFGELSRFVSEAWKILTPEQMAEYKALETTDKARYQTERTALLAANALAPPAVAPVSEEEVETKAPKAPKAPKTPKVKKEAPVVDTPAPVVASPATEKVKTPKAPKVKEAKPVAPTEAVSVPATAPSTDAKPAKAPKAKKEASAPVPVATPVVVEAPVSTPAKVKSASAPKAKAVKA